MVKDINPRVNRRSGLGFSSSPMNLTVIGDMLFFTAVTQATGRELWMTDGTLEGTVMLRDINPGRFLGTGLSSVPGDLTPVTFGDGSV